MDKIGLLYRVSSQSQETEGGGLELQQRLGKKISKQLGLPYIEFNEGVQSSYQVEINHRPVLVELLTEISKVNGIRKVWVFNKRLYQITLIHLILIHLHIIKQSKNQIIM